MAKSDYNNKLRQLIMTQQHIGSYVTHLKSNIKYLAKTSLDMLHDMPDEIGLQEIAVSSDFALLLTESLDDAIQHINNKLKTHYLEQMKEQPKSEEDGKG